MASVRLASNVSIRSLESKFDEMIDENTSYYIDTNSFSAADFDRFINSLEESYTVHHRNEGKTETERPGEACAEDDDDEYGIYQSLTGYARTELVSSYGGTPSTVSSVSSSLESLLQPDAPHNTLHHAERSPIVTRKSFLNIFQYFDQDVTLDRELLEEDAPSEEERSNRVSNFSMVELMGEKPEPRRGFSSKKSNKLVLREWDTNVERAKEVRPPTGRVSGQQRVGRLNEQLLKVFESEETPYANNSLARGWRTDGGKANATAPEKVPIVQHHRNPIGQPKKLAKSVEKWQNRDAEGKKTDRPVVATVLNVAADARQQVNHADSRTAKIVNAAPKIQQVLSKPAPNQRNLKDTSGTVPERDKCHVRNINDLFLQYRSRERSENGTFSDFNQHVREAIEEIEKIEENHVRSVLGNHAFEEAPVNTVNNSTIITTSSPSYVSEQPVKPTAAETDWEPMTVDEPPKLKLEAIPQNPMESALDMHYRLRHDTYRLQMNSLIETDQFVRMSAPDRNRLYLLDTIFNRSHLSLIHTVLALLHENIGKGDRVLLEASINGPVPSAISNRFVDTLAGGCYRIDAMTTSASGENCVELDVLAVDERTGLMLKITVEFVIDVADKLTYVRSRKANNVDEFHFVVRMVFEPPENELQKSHETGTNLSEHQLRVQASLQRLNIPDWYKQYSGKDGPANTSAPAPNTGAPGGILRKRNSDVGRWTGLSSKTTSLSSLGSHRSDRSPVMLSPSAHSHHGQTGFSRWSTSHLNSNQTSPSVSTRGSFTRGGLNASAMSGYSTASTTAGTAGTNSITGVGGPSTIRNSFRQPYLGWRSQEKLSQPRTPAERLASSLLQQQGNSSKQKEQHHQQQLKEQQQKGHRQQKEESVVTPEIQSSIIEVTSAIVHYVNDQTNRHSRSRSTSPSQRCWLESSFVGTRPLDSPQTPMIENSSVLGSSHQKQQHQQQQQQQTAGDHYRFNAGMNGVGVPTMASAAATVPSFSLPPEHQSPGSATLEDVLASLLGLPADSHRSSVVRVANPCLMPTAAAAAAANSSTINHTLQIEPMQTRRRSEGDAATRKRNDSGGSVAISSISATTTTTSGSTATQGGGPRSVDLLGATLDARIARRVSLDSAEAAGHAGHAGHGGHGGHGGPQQQQQHQLLKCRNPRCDASATLAEARRSYKSCHNCSHLYCSRECRRAHWERHRKACLHSRVSALCRLVLSTCKDDADSLRHLSALARRGYLSQGRGVVRILFRSPEAADSFIKQGFQCLGEVSYVRWPDLLPAEMGPELYSELLKLATEYKPDSKMLLYVAICVVSEAPGSATAGAVKWERQLVSRCAKLKLCRSVVSGELGAAGGGAGGTGPGVTGTGGTGAGGERAAPARKDTVGDVLVLAFNILAQTTPRAREQVSRNVQAVLRQRGVHLRKHYPEVSQRLATFVEGSTDRFLPVTLHPRDAVSGRSFVCIIMPNYGDADRVQFPVSENSDDRVVTVDVGAADLGDDLTSKL